MSEGKKNSLVVGIGDLCLDIVTAVPEIPETDMAQPLLGITSQGGGKVPTALVALGRLGVPCTLFATYGDDAAGTFCRQELVDAGVDTSHMVCIKGKKTNLTLCLAEQRTGGRSCIGKYDLPGVLPEDLDESVIRQAAYLHLWSFTPAAVQAAQWIHESGGKVIFDADRYSQETEKNIFRTDVFICSEFFFEGMNGKRNGEEDLKRGLEKIKAQGPGIVIVTLGAQGCAGMDEEGYFREKAFTNIQVVDSTGAGDVFHGAFIYGLLQKKNPRECARFASAVSAIKCTAQGGRTGIPDVKTTEKFIESGEIDRKIQKRWEAYYQEHAIV